MIAVHLDSTAPLNARTFHPDSLDALRHCLVADLRVYDTLIWGEGRSAIHILRLPFHRYRVTLGWNGRSERLGGPSATLARQALLKRLGVDE